ncbi:GIY-YIG nuclease family protein [Phenylobacterium sp.]|uniref:GIY-YIG nuclease family protein n=1 Tax=Phenylobacterium sp. TaxID=1871053 RepID=UPI0025D8CC57|nr:GIY-YIG nuclease family protein [Phenylobacterium sp.]MBX3483207.1 GIY-YIG nuclease family protein [Phenylobacterium sp.]MCW5760987.1 GIY-YIG nuclease family protein [Phenylobacterium sp.]
MDKQSRRELLRGFKEKKTAAGVYAVRCAASGEVWVGGSRNIDPQRNSIWFSLKQGAHMNRAMQAAWKAHGEGAFTYEVLERLEAEDMTPLGLADLTKARERHWIEALAAKKAVG